MFPFPSSVPITHIIFTNCPIPNFPFIVSTLLLFRCPSSFPLLFLPISFLLSSLTDTCVVFFQLGTSYYTHIVYPNYHIPNISLDCCLAPRIPISLWTCLVSSPFGTVYFNRGTYTNYQILNFHFLVCFSATPFPVFIVRLYVQISTSSDRFTFFLKCSLFRIHC